MASEGFRNENGGSVEVCLIYCEYLKGEEKRGVKAPNEHWKCLGSKCIPHSLFNFLDMYI